MRARPARGVVADHEVRAVHLLRLDRHHDLDDERTLDAVGDHPGNEVNSLEHHRPALLQRALDRRVDADRTWRVWSMKPSSSGSPASRSTAGSVSPASKLEWWTDGMNSCEKNAAQRLPDEVGARHAGDPEPVGDLGRDGGLARAGGAADEDDDR